MDRGDLGVVLDAERMTDAMYVEMACLAASMAIGTTAVRYSILEMDIAAPARSLSLGPARYISG